MQYSSVFVLLLALLPLLARSAYLVAPCSPNCYINENDPVTVTIIATDADVLPTNFLDLEQFSINSERSGSFYVAPANSDGFTFESNKTMSFTYIPSLAVDNANNGVVYGKLLLTAFDLAGTFFLENIPTGHIVYSVSMSGALSPLSFGLQFSLRYITEKPISEVALSAWTGPGTSYSGSSLSVSTTTDSTSIALTAAQEIPFGFTLGEQIYVNVSFVDGNSTRLYLTNCSDPQPVLGDVSSTMFAPVQLPNDFAVPSNVSLLPYENALVNKLQYVWVGGSYTCSSASVRQVSPAFYALTCPSSSQILAGSFGKSISVIAIVNFQYITRPEGTQIGFSLPKAPEVQSPAFPYTFSLGEDPVLLIYGSNFYTPDASLNIFNVTVGTDSSYICQGYAATNESVTCDIQGPPIPSDMPIYLTGFSSNGLNVFLPNILVAMSYSTAPVAPPMSSAPVEGPFTPGNSSAPQTAAFSGLQVGEIAGIAVVIAAVVILVIVLIVVLKRRRAASDNSGSDSDYSDDDELPEQPAADAAQGDGDAESADEGSAGSS